MITSLALGVKVAPLPILKVPPDPTPKLPLLVTAADVGKVKLKKFKVPELAILEPLFIVIVPEDGDIVQVELLVNVPATVKLVFAVTLVEEQDVVTLLNVKVPELLIEPPPLIVTVPELAIRLPLLLTVKSVLTV